MGVNLKFDSWQIAAIQSIIYLLDDRSYLNICWSWSKLKASADLVTKSNGSLKFEQA